MLFLSLLFFGALYFLQGAVLAFIINFQKPFLVSQGISREQIALLTSSMLLPFIGKMLLGVLSDRVPIGRFGRRKPYVAIGLTISMLSYFAIAFVAPASQYPLYFFLSVLATFGLALFDTTADGMAIDKTAEADQGTVQAAMLAGKSLGLILFSFLFGEVVQIYGVKLAFWTLSGLTIPILIACFLYSAPDKQSGIRPSVHGRPYTVPKAVFGIFGLFAVVYSITSFGVDGLMTLFMDQDLHATSREIGIFGSMRGVGALVGAVGGGLILRKLPRNRVIFLSLGCLMGAAFFNSFMVQGSPYWIWAIVWGAAWGFQETTYVTLAMALAIGPWSATLFALLMMFSNIGVSAGEAIATTLSAHYPAPLVLQGLALWLIPAFAIIIFYFRKLRA